MNCLYRLRMPSLLEFFKKLKCYYFFDYIYKKSGMLPFYSFFTIHSNPLFRMKHDCVFSRFFYFLKKAFYRYAFSNSSQINDNSGWNFRALFHSFIPSLNCFLQSLFLIVKCAAMFHKGIVYYLFDIFPETRTT